MEVSPLRRKFTTSSQASQSFHLSTLLTLVLFSPLTRDNRAPYCGKFRTDILTLRISGFEAKSGRKRAPTCESSRSEYPNAPIPSYLINLKLTFCPEHLFRPSYTSVVRVPSQGVKQYTTLLKNKPLRWLPDTVI